MKKKFYDTELVALFAILNDIKAGRRKKLKRKVRR